MLLGKHMKVNPLIWYQLFVQDPDLSAAVNKTPGIPLLYVHFNAIILEKPSQASLTAAASANSCKINPSDLEKSTLTKLKGESDSINDKRKKKRKGPKGPNPLSVKKKKKPDGGMSRGVGAETESKKSRKRKRMKIAPHVKQHIAMMASAS